MSTMSNTAGLDGLVFGPFRWNAVTYSNFLRDAYDNVIKTEVERLQFIDVENRKQADLTKSPKRNERSRNFQKSTTVNQSYDVEVAQLVQSLVDESNQVLGRENWTDIIGTDIWDILKLDELGNDRYKLDIKDDSSAALKKKSVVQLIKFIRNKISHIRTCKEELKKRLAQFFDKDEKDQFHFNGNKFVTFWISKFPKLVPYLWLKLYKFKDKLANYYPDHVIDITRFEDFLLDLNKFENEIKIASNTHMENGNVLERFKGPGCSLEFREFRGSLDKTLIVKITTLNGKLSLSVTHLSTNEDALVHEGSAPGTENVILIFAKNITDDKVWKHCCKCDSKVILFCDPDKLTNKKIEQAVGQFVNENNFKVELSESPIRGSELSTERQEWLFEHGEMCIQDKLIKIKDIFVHNNNLMDELSGKLLNKLLKQENPIIFADYKYPEYTGVYIKRKLVFRNETELFTYVFVNPSIETKSNYAKIGLVQEFNDVDHLCLEKASLKSDCKGILLHEPKNVSSEIVKKCKAALYPRLLFFPQFKANTDAMRVWRIACRQNYEREELTETKFLDRLFSASIKTVYIHAIPGMGKSKLLLSLGKALTKSLVIYSSFRDFVGCLQIVIGNRECTKLDIKLVIFEILQCKNDCERYLVDKWLEEKCVGKAKIELQLDGLDEVIDENLNLALKACEIIANDFDSIRLWITSSKTFHDKKADLQTAYCLIRPFLHNDKMDFFMLSWKGKSDEKKLKDIVYKLLTKHLTFPYLRFQEHFTDFPLNCSMIAEIYEDKLTELTLFNGSAVDLYDGLYKKRFAIMYKKIYGFRNETSGNFRLLRENYLQLHTYISFKHLYLDVNNEFVKPLSIKLLNQEDYYKMGIIIRDSQNVSFLHLTYAHFFVAQYIVDVLKTGELGYLCSKEKIDNLLYFGYPHDYCQRISCSVWIFLEKFLEKSTDHSSLKWLNSHQKEKHQFFMQKKICQLLSDAMESSLWNVARLLVNLWVDEQETAVCNEILEVTSKSDIPIHMFISLCQQFCFDNKNELVMCSVKKARYDIAKYLIDNWCENEVFDKIAEMRECGGGILHYLGLLNLERHHGKVDLNSFIEETKDFIRYVYEKSGMEIERIDSYGQNLLLIVPLIQKSLSLRIDLKHTYLLQKFLIEELNVDVNVASDDGESVLSLRKDWLSDTVNDSENAEIYHKRLLLVKDKEFDYVNLKSKKSSLTPLEEALYFFGLKLRGDSLKLFRDLGADFNVRRNRGGDTILHHSVRNCDDIELIKLLIECGSKIEVQNWGNQCALCLADSLGKIEMKNFFRQHLELREEQVCALNCSNGIDEESDVAHLEDFFYNYVQFEEMEDNMSYFLDDL